eukprot:1195907-Prorocentrum_minimum.AAC.2
MTRTLSPGPVRLAAARVVVVHEGDGARRPPIVVIKLLMITMTRTLSPGKGQCAWLLPVSWLSTKVTARLGHTPIRPGGRFCESASRQYSPLRHASCRMPLVVKSNAADWPPVWSIQFTISWRWPSCNDQTRLSVVIRPESIGRS